MSMIDIDKFIASILSNPSIEGTQLYHCIDKAIGEQGCMVHDGELVEVVVSLDMVEQKSIDPDIQKIIDCHFDEILDESNKENLHSYLYNDKDVPEDNFGEIELSEFESELHTVLSYFWQSYQRGEEVNLADFVKEHSEDLLSIARKEFTEEAVQWIREHQETVETEDNGIAGWIPEYFIEDFIRAMEE